VLHETTKGATIQPLATDTIILFKEVFFYAAVVVGLYFTAIELDTFFFLHKIAAHAFGAVP
jgi:hypothetical protein